MAGEHLLTFRAAQNRAQGSTLAELLVATLLLGVVAAGLVSLVVINNSQGQRLLNKVDGINAGRAVIARIGKNVRVGRSVGDVYGAIPAPVNPPINLVGILTGLLDLGGLDLSALGIPSMENGTITYSSASFPASGDPVWGGGQAPTSGWPWTGLRPFPYVLSPQTLIVQVPIFDAHGYPLVQRGSVVNWESVDTYVYQVLPDSSNPGQFIIQMAGFPGVGSSLQITSTPQTILRGITGPLKADGTASIFHYVSRDNPTTLLDTVADNEVANVSGVVVTLEILNQSNGPQPATISLKSEFYMRNNDQAVVLGE